MFKITGLDKLQKNLKDAQRALSELDGCCCAKQVFFAIDGLEEGTFPKSPFSERNFIYSTKSA